MINSYTRFAGYVLLIQVVTAVFSGAVLLRHFPMFHVMNAVIGFIIAILLLVVKWKWTPLVGILYGLLFTVLTVPSFFISMFRNIDPEYNAMLEASNPFIGVNLLTSICVIVIFIFSFAGLITNFKGDHNPPKWFSDFKTAFYGIALAGIMISLYLQFHWVTGVNEEFMDKLPTIVMQPDSVEPVMMEISSGEPTVLRLRNESKNACHILSFPELKTSVHMEQGRSGVVVIDPEPGTYTYECKEHHGYYNSNIKGKLVVKP